MFYGGDAFRHKQLKLDHTDTFAFSGINISLEEVGVTDKAHEWRTHWDYKWKALKHMTAEENNERLTEGTGVTIFRSVTSPLYLTSHSALYHVNLHQTMEDRWKHLPIASEHLQHIPGHNKVH